MESDSKAGTVNMEPETYLDTLTAATDSQKMWTTTVQVGDTDILFKVDTGAEVSAISEETFQSLPTVPQLQKSTRILYGPEHVRLNVVGEFTAELRYREGVSKQKLYVVRGLTRNLLGLPAIMALNLVVRVDSFVEDDVCEASMVAAYPNVFQGLGEFGEPYRITLVQNAKPHAIFTPRRIPIPLRSRVKDELAKMEADRVISKVDQVTEWCSGMVAVLKKSGSIRICVDLQHLNSSVLREIHPLPRVEETLGLLAGAKIFSRLNANSGFWQIPLAKDSRPLTTFLTPFRRFWCNKLPFGISSAPEHFHKQINKVLEGLDGVVCQMDDMPIQSDSIKVSGTSGGWQWDFS